MSSPISKKQEGESFVTLKAPSDIPPLVRPSLLIPPKEFHLLGTKSSNIGAYEVFLIHTIKGLYLS